MNCWICDKEEIDYFLLPEKEEKFEIPLKKSTYELRTIDKVVFLYYIVCDTCLTNYLDNYPVNFKKLMKREISSKKLKRIF